MSADELMKAIRGGREKLRLDQMALVTPSGQLTGKGVLCIEGDKLQVDMALDEGVRPPPRLQVGVATASEFWKLNGVIEDNLPFWCNFGPGVTEHHSNGFVTLSRTVNHIHIGKQLWRRWPAKIANNPRADASDPLFEETDPETLLRLVGIQAKLLDVVEEINQSGSEDLSFEFHAWIDDYELISTNGGSKTVRTDDFHKEAASSESSDVLKGETPHYEFAFFQQTEDGKKGLHIVLRSKVGIYSVSEEEDREKFNALLTALAFTHGKNSWPYRVRYWRGRHLSDTITPIRELANTPHAPFSGLRGNVELAPLIERMATEFGTRSLFTQKLTYLLFLARQAGDSGVQHEIGTLGICTLFESLIGLLFEHFGLKEKTAESMPGFAETKDKLLAHMKTWPNTDSDTNYLGFKGMLESAGALTMREKFEAVCSHMQIKWEDGMKSVFFTWKAARNPLAHGKFKTDDDPENFKDLAYAESRIGGGLNTILLKYFGYVGYYNASVIEPGFTHMDNL